VPFKAWFFHFSPAKFLCAFVQVNEVTADRRNRTFLETICTQIFYRHDKHALRHEITQRTYDIAGLRYHIWSGTCRGIWLVLTGCSYG